MASSTSSLVPAFGTIDVVMFFSRLEMVCLECKARRIALQSPSKISRFFEEMLPDLAERTFGDRGERGDRLPGRCTVCSFASAAIRLSWFRYRPFLSRPRWTRIAVAAKNSYLKRSWQIVWQIGDTTPSRNYTTKLNCSNVAVLRTIQTPKYTVEVRERK